MRKKHKMVHLTKKDIEEVRHIQETTTCNYNKKGNVNSMNPYRNVTVAKYDNYAALLHNRKDMGTYHYDVNVIKQKERKYGRDAVIKMFGKEIERYL